MVKGKYYSKEEVAEKLNLPIEEINSIEISALSSLKEQISQPLTKIKSSSN